MANGHAKLSPSASHRWLVCPASVEASKDVVSPDNEHSIAGTAGHWVHEVWLRAGMPPAAGTKAPNGVEVTQEMIDHVGVSVGWVRRYLDEHGPARCTLLTEERIEVGRFFGLPEGVCYGTSDTVIMCPEELVIHDLKLGYVDVPVDENPQLTLYALGMMEELGWIFPEIRFVIAQPKNGGVKEHIISRADLLKAGEALKPKVLAATKPNAPFVPSEDGCRYCPVAGVCKALQTEALEIARREFDDTPAALVERISLSDLTRLLEKAPVIEAAIKAAREHATKLLSLGQPVPGWKLVESRKNRAWKEGVERAVIENAALLGFDLDDVAPRKMCSPAQAEKKGLGQLAEKFAEKPRGEPVLAPESDRRPALPPEFTAVDVGNLLE